ncbi:hypothetical protein LLH00_08240 [bacterium]|nr:hypothetical protein [bacterium]
MNGINRLRVLAGGLVAGLVLATGEFVLSKPILGERWALILLNHNLPRVTMGRVGIFFALNLLLGLVLICIYASIRPRYGAGPRTAVRAGLLVWLLVWACGYGMGWLMWLFPTGMTLTAILWGLVEAPLAALAGAWVYKE